MSPIAAAQKGMVFPERAVAGADCEDGEEDGGAGVGTSLVEVVVIDTHPPPGAEGGFSFSSTTPAVPLISVLGSRWESARPGIAGRAAWVGRTVRPVGADCRSSAGVERGRTPGSDSRGAHAASPAIRTQIATQEHGREL